MDIPRDVLTLILIRLPVKSLMKFRCVCKFWRSLIGSRRFIDLHLQHSSQGRWNEYLVLKRSENENTVLSFYSRDQDGGDLLEPAALDWRAFPQVLSSIGGPINGVCLVGGDLGAWLWVGGEVPDEHPLYLCNPATREFQKIPDRPFGTPRSRAPKFGGQARFHDMRLGVGFGYDHRTDDYKVISIMHFVDDLYLPGGDVGDPLMMEIYNSSSNSWRVSNTIFPTIPVRPGMDDPPSPQDLNKYEYSIDEYCRISEFTFGLFFNGFIHWDGLGAIKVIWAFNIINEVMRVIHLPRCISPSENRFARSLFVLDDSLAFVQRVMCEDGYHDVPTSSFYVWVMVEYGNEKSWIKRFHLQPSIYMRVLAYWNDMLICETKNGELASCNIQEDAPHQFRIHHGLRGNMMDDAPRRLRNLDGVCGNMMGAIVMHKESLVRIGEE